MSFINKNDSVVINIKLTSRGRELLSQGKLKFDYFALGDSEIDYNFLAESNLDVSELEILRPFDKNPEILSFISKTIEESPYNPIYLTPSFYQVVNSVEPIGFFNVDCTEFLIDSNHVKQPDVMIDMSTVNGGKILTLLKSPTYGISTEEPTKGDLLLVKWASSNISTTGHTINKTLPTPYLIYKIVDINSGTLSSGSVTVTVDRDLPDFSNYPVATMAGALIYYDFINYSGSSAFNMSPTDYLDESVLTFLQNSQCPTIKFPFWNMNIVFTEEIAGVVSLMKKYTEFNSSKYAGFLLYIQNQSKIYQKLGIIHYSNNSPANVYGEGFYLNNISLDIPTIMWHKSSDKSLGLKLIPNGTQKLFSGETKSLNTIYYDLADLNGNIVGKVFPELKLFTIEDQELLFALSYKSNRSWTLPDYYVGTTEKTPCPETSPIVLWKNAISSNPNLTIVGQYYCHSTTNGWVEIPQNQTISTTAPINSGYKIVAQVGPASSGTLSLFVKKISDDSVVCAGTPVTGAPNSTITATITNFNYDNNYYFIAIGS